MDKEESVDEDANNVQENTGINEKEEKQQKIITTSPNIKNENAPELPNSKKWLEMFGWKRNPFTFDIKPLLFVGYDEQRNMLMNVIQQRHKIILISGPTGSGKTTLVKWTKTNLPDDFYSIYVGKAPEEPHGLIDVMTNGFKPRGFFSKIFSLFSRHITNLYELPDYLNEKLRGRHLVIFFDEIHEANNKILEWIRVLSDHLDNASVVLAGLPVFESKLDSLETLRKRIAAKIELLSLTKEETYELLRKRIEAAGGKGDEFDYVLNIIYERTGGFPREVIRMCNEILNTAMQKNERLIRPEMLKFELKKELPSINVLEQLTPMQKTIIENLQKPQTPGQIADLLNLEKYKTRQHAVRSVNNVLKVLMEQGFVERVKEENAYVYHLAPRIKTLVVKS